MTNWMTYAQLAAMEEFNRKVTTRLYTLEEARLHGQARWLRRVIIAGLAVLMILGILAVTAMEGHS
jgi:hypothetical protein